LSTIYLYNDGFLGFLTSIYEIYSKRENPLQIVSTDSYSSKDLFSTTYKVHTDTERAKRVRNGLIDIIGKKGLNNIYKVYLSEEEDIELLLYRYIQKVFKLKQSIDEHLTDDIVLYFSQVLKKIHREEHRMHAFVRFKLSSDNVYISTIEPDFNVLPLLPSFFENRFTDQKWMIYDIKRGFGIYYDLEKTIPIELEQMNNKQQREALLHEDELDYQKLWKDYFDSTNIKERKNTKLHLQHVPKRYWKYLPEKYLNV